MKLMRRGFTLVELLTVLAITSVLLVIITVPLIQSFNITRAAQGYADAQERARIVLDQITREVGNASFVRDTTGDAGAVNITLPTNPNQTAGANTYVPVRLENARLDIIAPAQGDPTIAPGGGLIDPRTGKVDPTLRTPRGDLVLPATQSFRLIRYFVGLRNPIRGPLGNEFAGRYTNPYDGLLMRRSGEQDNLFVLYRAEVDLRVYNPATNAWEINRDLFDRDNNGTATAGELNVALDDPSFFLIDDTANAGVRTAQARRIRAWLLRSRIVTEISRYDMIQPVFDKQSRVVETYVENAITKPRVVSLIQFTPQRVSNEPMSGLTAVRSGEESDNSEKVGPDVFVTDLGNWQNPIMRLRPSTLLDSVGNYTPSHRPNQNWFSNTSYIFGKNDNGFKLFVSRDLNDEAVTQRVVFDGGAYLLARDTDPADPVPVADPTNTFRYPFSFAVLQAANDRAAAGANGAVTAAELEQVIPVVPDSKEGKILASYAVTEVGSNAGWAAQQTAGIDNRPIVLTGNPVPPAADPANNGRNPGVGTNLNNLGSTLPNAGINDRFNALYYDLPGLFPGLDVNRFARRFVDARAVPQRDLAAGPFDARTYPFARRASIVPGSEVIIGPDQFPGPNYGRPVRYSRVTVPDTVGPNQYFINYVDQREPNWADILGVAVDNRVYDRNGFIDPASYTGVNRLIVEFLQPRYRAGYIEFNSRPGEPLPGVPVGSGGGNLEPNISIYYRFQYTEPNDVIELDYDSRQLMNVNLTIRNFPQTTLPNQQNVTVKGQATVRNFIR